MFNFVGLRLPALYASQSARFYGLAVDTGNVGAVPVGLLPAEAAFTVEHQDVVVRQHRQVVPRIRVPVQSPLLHRIPDYPVYLRVAVVAYRCPVGPLEFMETSRCRRLEQSAEIGLVKHPVVMCRMAVNSIVSYPTEVKSVAIHLVAVNSIVSQLAEVVNSIAREFVVVKCSENSVAVVNDVLKDLVVVPVPIVGK